MAGDMLRRKISGDDGDIFGESDCVNTQSTYATKQMQDTFGKGEVDAKMVAKVTGATSVLKKPKNRGHPGVRYEGLQLRSGGLSASTASYSIYARDL